MTDPVYLEDERATASLARRVADAVGAGDVIHLVGPVGVGKTTLVRHLCAARGVEEDVTSPTFSIAHLYQGDGIAIGHIDLYRTERLTPSSVGDLEAYLGEDLLVIIEWPEAGYGLPDPTLVIALEFGDGDGRVAHLRWLRERVA